MLSLFRRSGGDRPEADAETAAARALLKRAAAVLQAAAEGDLEQRILHVEGEGDVQTIVHAINGLLDRVDAFVRESQAALEHASEGKYYRRVLPQGMLGSFRRAVNVINAATERMAEHKKQLDEDDAARLALAERVEHTAIELVAAADELRSTTRNISSTAAAVADRCSVVSTTTRQFTSQIREMAAATQGLAANAGEVSVQVNEACGLAGTAVEEAARTQAVVVGLAESSRQIGAVTKLINEVAFKTRILALNASIEAARVGDLGKGFGVVANEVNQVAARTAEAASEIEGYVDGIQTSSTGAVDAITRIGDTVRRVETMFDAMTHSSTRQLDSSRKMTSNPKELADGTQIIETNIGEVLEGTRDTQVATSQMLTAVCELSNLAESLREEAERLVERGQRTPQSRPASATPQAATRPAGPPRGVPALR